MITLLVAAGVGEDILPGFKQKYNTKGGTAPAVVFSITMCEWLFTLTMCTCEWFYFCIVTESHAITSDKPAEKKRRGSCKRYSLAYRL